jgi:hypothetical protein
LPSNTFIESERLSLAFEKLITHTIFLNPAAAFFIVAIRLRALQRNHGLNIECHTTQVIGQSIEEVALPYVGGSLPISAQSSASVSDFSSFACRSSTATPRALPPHTAGRSGEMSYE